GISLPEGIPAAADIVNLRYKSCPEMEGQDQADYFDDIVKEYLSPFDFAKKHLRFDPAFRYFSYSMIIRSIY
ncbi:hypothetical protein, partial [Enterobacter kobei]|uniref:hypothetical protein n=1 Tax=Enterobacter kobei TaxID=208224 RepID=UPI002006C569